MRPVYYHTAEQQQDKKAHHGRLVEPPFSLLDDHQRDQESRSTHTQRRGSDGTQLNITNRPVADRYHC